MTESANFGVRGAEISERSTELVLPGTGSRKTNEPMRERMTGVSRPEATTGRESDGRYRTAGGAAATAAGETLDAPRPPEQRGIALPGDRGRESQGDPKQRPSFWRRIALGRRVTKAHDESSLMNQPAPTSTAPLARSPRPPTADSIENRIVEPMLQALVSVEAKLERSHIDLIGRSDQIEQRLSQLWEIEEQLGTLGELQESLLQVSEQQRRLESVIASQNKTQRWLVGAVFCSLAVAVFVVSAVLQ